MRIKKGESYECVKEVLKPSGDVWGGGQFIVGEVYKSRKDGELNEKFKVNGFYDYTSHFKKVTSKKSLKKRVKALEDKQRELEQDFKAIGIHAQRIIDIIKDAP